MSHLEIVTPHGRLDAPGALLLEAKLREHFGSGRINLLVDLTDVDYISSVGLRVLLTAMRLAAKDDGALVLCCLKPRVLEIFAVAGFDRVFRIVPSRVQAELTFRE